MLWATTLGGGDAERTPSVESGELREMRLPVSCANGTLTRDRFCRAEQTKTTEPRDVPISQTLKALMDCRVRN